MNELGLCVVRWPYLTMSVAESVGSLIATSYTLPCLDGVPAGEACHRWLAGDLLPRSEEEILFLRFSLQCRIRLLGAGPRRHISTYFPDPNGTWTGQGIDLLW
ncbi:hypothetical protein YC2023_017996 [Brassica napus]